MRFLAPSILLLLAPVHPALSRDCASLVASACAEPGETAQEPKTLAVETAPPALAAGDLFPVEGRSLLMNPTRYKLPPVDGAWRYYAIDGVVYRVDNATTLILEVIRDSRTWHLR
jgi:hypothetical protein